MRDFAPMTFLREKHGYDREYSELYARLVMDHGCSTRDALLTPISAATLLYDTKAFEYNSKEKQAFNNYLSGLSLQISAVGNALLKALAARRR